MKWFLLSRLNREKQYLYSTGMVVLVSAICYGLAEPLGYRVVALILLLTVSLLAITFDILPVLVSAALSAFIWDVFFIPPQFTIHVSNTEDLFLLVMYFVIAMINGVLTYKIRQAEKISTLKEEKANSVKLYNTILNSLSHELRTPIAAIIAASDNLQMNQHLSKEVREQLVLEISKASLRLNQQVENLLNISRLESGHIRPKNDWCDIVELIYSVVMRIEESHSDRQIQVSVNQGLPLVSIDKGMLEQIIFNLLNNAAIHTSPGTHISIAARCHSDLLEIIIEDNGHGFTELDFKTVFQKFSRSNHPENSGSGLGLSIVKGFTEALEGTVELRRGVDNGSEFTILIPVKTAFPKMIDNE